MEFLKINCWCICCRTLPICPFYPVLLCVLMIWRMISYFVKFASQSTTKKSTLQGCYRVYTPSVTVVWKNTLGIGSFTVQVVSRSTHCQTTASKIFQKKTRVVPYVILFNWRRKPKSLVVIARMEVMPDSSVKTVILSCVMNAGKLT